MRLLAILFAVFTMACSASERTAPTVYRDPFVRIVDHPDHETLNRKLVLRLQHDGDLVGCRAERRPAQIPARFPEDSGITQPVATTWGGCDSVVDDPGATMPLDYDSISMLAYTTLIVSAVGKNNKVVSDSIRLPIYAADGASCEDISVSPTVIRDNAVTAITTYSKSGIMTFTNQNRSYAGSQTGVGRGYNDVVYLSPHAILAYADAGTITGPSRDRVVPYHFRIPGPGGIVCPFELIVKGTG